MRCRKIYGETDPSTMGYLDDLVELLDCADKSEEAEALTRRALFAREAKDGDCAEQTIRCVTNLAVLLDKRPQDMKAVEAWRSALEKNVKAYGKTDAKTVDCTMSLAQSLAERGRRPEAVRLLDDLMGEVEAQPDADEAHIYTCLRLMANIYEG